jgi:hypothetical protein
MAANIAANIGGAGESKQRKKAIKRHAAMHAAL